MRGDHFMLTSGLHGYVHTPTLTNTYTTHTHTHTNKYIQYILTNKFIQHIHTNKYIQHTNTYNTHTGHMYTPTLTNTCNTHQ